MLLKTQGELSWHYAARLWHFNGPHEPIHLTFDAGQARKFLHYGGILTSFAPARPRAFAGGCHGPDPYQLRDATAMKQAITGYHRDDATDWVAELACGHDQHVRHAPPWIMREWVTSEKGRQRMLGALLECKKCDRGEAPDRPNPDRRDM
jgi:hypothetical protein